MLIECKSTKAGPYAGFGPADRKALSFMAKLAGAEAWLYWKPKRGDAVWIPESNWP
jgi:Holliday junction resolvase